MKIEDMSKIFADIFMHPLRDCCCCRVNASALEASRNRAEKSEMRDIMVVRCLFWTMICADECKIDLSVAQIAEQHISCSIKHVGLDECSPKQTKP